MTIHYLDSERISHGPYTAEEFSAIIASGAISAQTWIHIDDDPDWQLYSLVASRLNHEPAAKAPPMPPAYGGQSSADAPASTNTASPTKTESSKPKRADLFIVFGIIGLLLLASAGGLWYAVVKFKKTNDITTSSLPPPNPAAPTNDGTSPPPDLTAPTPVETNAASGSAPAPTLPPALRSPDEPVILKLDRPAELFFPAASGALLILTHDSPKAFSVFSVEERKVLWRLSPEDPDAFAAADAEKLYIFEPRLRRISAISLTEGKVVAYTLTGEKLINAVAGYSAVGMPFLVTTDGGLALFHPSRMILKLLPTAAGRAEQPSGNAVKRLRAAANGELACLWRLGLSPAGVYRAKIRRSGELEWAYEHSTAGYLAPDAGGAVIYTSAGGILLSSKLTEQAGTKGPLYFPGIEANTYARLGWGQTDAVGVLRMVLGGTVPDFTLRTPELNTKSSHPVAMANDEPGFDRRVWLYASKRLLITMGMDNQSLYFRNF